MRPHALAAALVAVAALSARAGRAEDAAGAAPRSWSEGPARPFLSTRLDGGLYARAIGAAGWGKPHWMWAGAQGYALTSRDYAAAAFGLRANLLVADLEVDLRRSRPWRHRFLDPLAEHRSSELDAGTRGRAEVTSLDVDLSGVVPTPGGLALWEVMWVRALDAPGGAQLYEEWNRVVQGRDGILFRALWMAGLLGDRLRIGPLGEGVALPGRGAAVWRVGGAGSWKITPRLDVTGFIAFPVASPDRLDFMDALNGSLALRWTWATGPRP